MMMTEAFRNAIAARFFTATLLLITLFAATGYARPSFAGNFTLPYEVHWGKTILPAGNYRIFMEELDKTATIESTDGTMRFFVPIPAKSDSQGGTAGLVLLIRGNERVVRALNLPHSGYSLVYQPQTRAERELLAKADHVATVPLGDKAK